MATSGTVSTTVVQVDDLIATAVRRCGALPVQVAFEQQLSLARTLFYILTNLANRSITLWEIKRILVPLYPGQARYDMPNGTVDIKNALWRNPSRVSPVVVTSDSGGTVAFAVDSDVATVFSQVAINGSLQFDAGAGNTMMITLLGLLPGLTQTLNLVLEVSDDGLTWVQVTALGAVNYVDGEWVWTDIDPALQARFFRVRETAGGTLNFREVFVCQNWTDLTMARLNRDTYASLPQKTLLSTQPLQYWLDKQNTPVMVVWPMPQNTFSLMSLFLRQYVQDVGALSNTLDVPQRWLPYIQAELSRRTFFELPKDMIDPARKQDLQMDAENEWNLAESEERDNSPVNIAPNIRGYTR